NRNCGPRRRLSGKDRFINVDDRTDRDIRLRKVSGSTTADDTGDRADNPARTMPGATELAWLEQTLLTTRQHGQTWKIVATSSPIDRLGVIPRKEVQPWVPFQVLRNWNAGTALIIGGWSSWSRGWSC